MNNAEVIAQARDVKALAEDLAEYADELCFVVEDGAEDFYSTVSSNIREQTLALRDAVRVLIESVED